LKYIARIFCGRLWMHKVKCTGDDVTNNNTVECTICGKKTIAGIDTTPFESWMITVKG